MLGKQEKLLERLKSPAYSSPTSGIFADYNNNIIIILLG